MLSKLDHIAITVTDLAASVRFYTEALGLEKVEQHGLDGPGISRMAGHDDVQLEVVRLVAPGTSDVRIDLQHYLHPESARTPTSLGDIGNTHFCLTVDDLDQAHGRLSALGAEFVSTPVDLELDGETLKVVFMKDPDGYVIELFQA
jgi:catechol 2,3-dioxygenase-like lactoylglutathione lyase family enzyme